VEVEYPLTVLGGAGWYLARFSPILAPAGARPTVSMFVRDITARRGAEAALRDSEGQLSALVASLDDLVIEVDERGTYLNLWAATESLLVRPAAEMLGRTVSELLDPDTGRLFMEAIRRALATGQPVELEYPLEVLGGARWFQARLNPILARLGAAPTLSMFVRDITSRRQAEAALRDSEQKFRSFIEQSLAGFTLVDEHGLISEWNHAREQMTGLPRAQALGRLYADVQFELVPPEDREPERLARNRQLIAEALRTGQAPFFDQNLTEQIRLPDGTQRTLQQVVFPIRTDQGFCLGSVSYDVTEQLQRERELESISAVSVALRAAPTRAEMVPIILDQVLALLHAEGSALDLLEPDSQEVVVQAARGLWETAAGSHIPLDQAVLADVLRTGQPYLSGGPDHDPRFASPALLVGARAMLGVPLIVDGQAFGGLWAGRPAPFQPDEVRLLAAMADMAASALHRANLHEQTERRLHQLTALRAIDAAINSSMGLSITLNVVLDQVMPQLQTDAAAVLLLNRETQKLDYAAGRGFRTGSLERPSLPLGPNFASQAVLERRLVSQPDLSGEAPEASRLALLAGEGFQAYYGVPLSAKGEVLGVLEVFHRAPLRPDADWLEFLEALGGQAAIAIDNARLVDNLQRSNYELIQAYDATIEGWTRALDLRDKETEGHSQRVTALTLELCVALGMQAPQLEHIRRGALLHDIGKMGVPDSILLKPGPLTADEWVAMRLHPTFAYKMLKPIEYLAPALEIPYCHHEKWDGTGYPRGLKGNAIPLAARIFAVVDVWDALRSDRPYRPAWPADKVREHIRALAGTHFDPRVVQAALDNGAFGHDDDVPGE
jgi:PAS domain S-box-containing protein/putative nucleotidyltransferase with HDIG domain